MARSQTFRAILGDGLVGVGQTREPSLRRVGKLCPLGFVLVKRKKVGWASKRHAGTVSIVKKDKQRGGRGPEAIGSVLRRALRGMDLGARLPELDLRRKWNEIAGKDLARFVRPGALQQGTLLLEVPSGAWAQEILALQSEILGRIQEKLRLPGIERIQVRIVRSRKKDESPAIKPPERPASAESLPSTLQEKISAIADPEIRQALAKFVAESREG